MTPRGEATTEHRPMAVASLLPRAELEHIRIPAACSRSTCRRARAERSIWIIDSGGRSKYPSARGSTGTKLEVLVSRERRKLLAFMLEVRGPPRREICKSAPCCLTAEPSLQLAGRPARNLACGALTGAPCRGEASPGATLRVALGCVALGWCRARTQTPQREQLTQQPK